MARGSQTCFSSPCYWAERPPRPPRKRCCSTSTCRKTTQRICSGGCGTYLETTCDSLLGHEDVSTTMIYMHVLNKRRSGRA
jgi:hypothetical protein